MDTTLCRAIKPTKVKNSKVSLKEQAHQENECARLTELGVSRLTCTSFRHFNLTPLEDNLNEFSKTSSSSDRYISLPGTSTSTIPRHLIRAHPKTTQAVPLFGTLPITFLCNTIEENGITDSLHQADQGHGHLQVEHCLAHVPLDFCDMFWSNMPILDVAWGSTKNIKIFILNFECSAPGTERSSTKG